MALNQVGQRLDPGIVFVERRDVVIGLAAGRNEIVAAFLSYFFQRLEAVGNEAGADDIDALLSLSAQCLQRWCGVGLQPFGLAEARLETDFVLVVVETQSGGKQPAGFVALAEIGVAKIEAAFGQAVMLDCHSMPAAASGLHESDIVLGDRFGGACAPILMAEATRFLKEAGLRVARNNPYAGGYATEHYGKPGQNQHCLQIEINRSLYMVEGAMTKRPAFESVAATMAGLVGHIVDVAESLALKHAS